jgi:hypothetical protein
MAVSNDPLNPLHLAIMAEPIESPNNTTCEIIWLVIHHIIRGMMPRHALQRVRRYLSRQCIKPRDMDVCTYYQCLKYISTKELQWIPPFEPGQAFDDDTIKEILLFATPPEWQCEMDRMGFDPTHSNSLDVLHFMENVESAETSIPARTGVRSLLSRFSARAQGTGQRNTNP